MSHNELTCLYVELLVIEQRTATSRTVGGIPSNSAVNDLTARRTSSRLAVQTLGIPTIVHYKNLTLFGVYYTFVHSQFRPILNKVPYTIPPP